MKVTCGATQALSRSCTATTYACWRVQPWARWDLPQASRWPGTPHQLTQVAGCECTGVVV
jgi:hypothetical protein